MLQTALPKAALRSRTGGTWGLGSCSNVAPGLHLRFIRHRVSRNNI